MPERISPETRKLLDRAQRAIEDAISLRENTRDQIASARQQRLLLEIMLSQFPPPCKLKAASTGGLSFSREAASTVWRWCPL